MSLNDDLRNSIALCDAPPIEYGIFEEMAFEDYRRIDAVNYSSLKNMMRSPMSYRYFKDHPKEATAAMALGGHMHRMTLEPNKVGDFAVWGEIPGQNVRRGKVWDDFQAECAASERQIITKEERDAMIGMSKSVRMSSMAMRYLDGGHSEVTAVWKDQKFNRPCKGRFDKLKMISGRMHIVDLKTCRDCRPFRFGNEAYRIGYHIQLYMYQEGYRILTGETPVMVEIAVENKPPYELVVYSITEDVLWKGMDDYTRLMKMLAECERTNVWPPAEEAITDLTLPSYAYGSDADEYNFAELTTD